MNLNELLDSDVRRCYYLQETQPDPTRPDPTDRNSFLVCLVFENESGFFPATGNGPCASPWYWNKETCEEQNRRKFNLTPEEAFKIVASSMFPKPAKKRRS